MLVSTQNTIPVKAAAPKAAGRKAHRSRTAGHRKWASYKMRRISATCSCCSTRELAPRTHSAPRPWSRPTTSLHPCPLSVHPPSVTAPHPAHAHAPWITTWYQAKFACVASRSLRVRAAARNGPVILKQTRAYYNSMQSVTRAARAAVIVGPWGWCRRRRTDLTAFLSACNPRAPTAGLRQAVAKPKT